MFQTIENYDQLVSSRINKVSKVRNRTWIQSEPPRYREVVLTVSRNDFRLLGKASQGER